MAETAALVGAYEPVILTVDNGGTNTRVARGEERIRRIDAYPTPESYEVAIARLAQSAFVLLDGKRPDMVSFSLAGKVENGQIVSAGKLEKHGWKGRPFAEDVAAEMGISPDRVILRNDCAAGATAERTARQPQPGEMGAFMVLSTGFGGALYTADEIIADEPGHHYLKPGAVCGDGQEGHNEAHIGGAGITVKFGLPDAQTEGKSYLLHGDPRWQEVKSDFHEAMSRTLERYGADHDRALRVIGFTGSVALGGPRMLEDLQEHLTARFGTQAPRIEEAVYGEQSGLYGAMFAADEVLRAA